MANNIIHINDNFGKKPVFELKNYIVRSSLTSFSQASKNAGLSVKYVLSGMEHYRIDGNALPLNSGQFLVVNQGQEIECKLEGERPIQGLCMYVDEALVAARIANAYYSDCQLLDLGSDQKWLSTEIVNQFKDVVYTASAYSLGQLAKNTANSIDGLSDYGTGAFFHHLADELIKHHHQETKAIQDIGGLKKSTREEIHKRITHCTNFIYSNFHQELSLAKLAKVACMSEFHFLRSFKSAMGLTPHQFINHFRLEQAAKLLIDGPTMVSEIGCKVGFQDASGFGRVFKRYFNMSPIEYRKMMA